MSETDAERISRLEGEIAFIQKRHMSEKPKSQFEEMAQTITDQAATIEKLETEIAQLALDGLNASLIDTARYKAAIENLEKALKSVSELSKRQDFTIEKLKHEIEVNKEQIEHLKRPQGDRS